MKRGVNYLGMSIPQNIRSPIPEGGLVVPIEVTLPSDDQINHDLNKIKSLIAENNDGFDCVKDVEHNKQ